MTRKEVLQQLLKEGTLTYNPNTKTGGWSKRVYEILELPQPGVRDLPQLAVAFRNIWPAGIKSGGLYVRSGMATIEGKLRKFLKKFPNYTREEILQAAEKYVEESRRDNYQYMKTAEYFIFKNEGSTLETYCEIIKNRELESAPQSNLRM
ncbi:MAG: hypothetical protein JSW41_04085 [Candidatus Aenigmatarchaeota archaeon]|nr:MAG: hypothetical protein JSW41_04085 [Candidatus Aenigmarchaeota archaeon]